MIIGVIISLALLIVNYYVVKRHLIKSEVDEDDLMPSYNPSSPLLGTINWIGFTFLGCYRCFSGTFVTYRFISFILPIVPIGCYRVKDVTEQESKSLGNTKYYQIYGKEPWRFWEVFHIYVLKYAGMAFAWFSLATILQL